MCHDLHLYCQPQSPYFTKVESKLTSKLFLYGVAQPNIESMYYYCCYYSSRIWFTQVLYNCIYTGEFTLIWFSPADGVLL